MEKRKLFPQFLDEGSNGPAVFLLQLLIRAIGNNLSASVIADGDYTIGGKTGDWVANLQMRHGITKDRNFGPETRAAFLEETGIDVDLINAECLQGETSSFSEPPPLSDKETLGLAGMS